MAFQQYKEKEVILESRLEVAEKNNAYLRDSLAMSCPTLGNIFKNVRSKFYVYLEWILGNIITKLRSHRLRRVSWSITEPAPRLICISGDHVQIKITFRDIDGRPAKRIYARLGSRLLSANLLSEHQDGYLNYLFDFTTKPGWKFIRIYAHLESGAEILLGYRLFLVRPRIHPQKTPFFASPALPALNGKDGEVPLLPPENIKIRADAKPQVSIIIPIYNQTAYTLRCLQAIALHTTNISYEVLVIDDCSPEPAVEVLRGVKGLRLFRNKTNQGFILNCNFGASKARGKYLVFLNNDTEVQPRWLEALLKTFEQHSGAGLVGAKLVYPDGTLQEAGGIIWKDGSAWNYGRNDDPEKPEYNYVRETDYCSGACIMIPGTLYRQVGGFDETFYPAYCEDSDLAFKVREAGRKTYYQPAAIVLHHEGKSNGTDTAEGLKKYQITNSKKLAEKWAHVFNRDHYQNAMNVFRARERSRGKKIILIIDHYLPHYDKDAGSLTIWSYINFFLKQGFSIKFIGDNFHPHQPYLQEMQQKGVEVLWGQWYGLLWERWLEKIGMEIDYVLLSRAHVVRRYLPALRRCTNAKLLFYGHDLLSLTFEREFAVTQVPATLKSAKEWRQMEEEVFEQVDIVYYPSIEEVAHLATHYPKIKCRVLPPYVYPPQRLNYASTIQKRSGILFVGGFRHLPNVNAMLWFCREIFPKVRALMPTAQLTIVGSYPPPEILALEGPGIRITGYVSDQKLVELYDSHMLVIAPLRHGGGIKGKIIEAMWHGLPVVTTEVGVSGIPGGDNACAVADQTNFHEILLQCMASPAQLILMSKRGVDIIAQNYSELAIYNTLKEDIDLAGIHKKS
jgi:GT2 family glycosyltransferase